MTDSALVVRQAHADMDAKWRELVAENDQRKTAGVGYLDLACGRGCGACCSFMVDVNTAEAALLADVVETSPDRDDMVDRLLRWEADFLRWLTDNPAPHPRDQWTAHQLWRQRWGLLRVACPLLDLADHSCRAYADRPGHCRAHHAGYPPPGSPVDLDPPDGCFIQPAYAERGELQRVWAIPGVADAFSDHLERTLDAAGIEWQTSVLTVALLAAGRARHHWPTPTCDLPPSPRLTTARVHKDMPEINETRR